MERTGNGYVTKVKLVCVYSALLNLGRCGDRWVAEDNERWFILLHSFFNRVLYGPLGCAPVCLCFSLCVSVVDLANQQPGVKGMGCPPSEEMKMVVDSAGGQWLPQIPKVNTRTSVVRRSHGRLLPAKLWNGRRGRITDNKSVNMKPLSVCLRLVGILSLE